MHDENVSTFLSFLEAEDAALSFLQKSYQHLGIPDAETRSYQNISAFLAYLEHGKSYYSYGKDAPLLMKPVLLFYGMTHFMKASLLLTRPDYPESTADLAHGLSTRKRKSVTINSAWMKYYPSSVAYSRIFHVTFVKGNFIALKKFLWGICSD